MKTLHIPHANIKEVKKVISTLMKRAAILEVTPPEIQFTGSVRYVQVSPLKILTLHELTVEGEAPVLEDWKLVARINHANGLEDTPNQVRVFGEVAKAQIEAFNVFGRKSHCDHCEANRKRKTTYVLEHRDMGEWVQVGSTCINDFTRQKSLKYLEAFELLMDKLAYAGGDTAYQASLEKPDSCAIAVKDVFTVISELLSKGRFISKSQAYSTGECATAEKVMMIFNEEDGLPEARYTAQSLHLPQCRQLVTSPEAVKNGEDLMKRFKAFFDTKDTLSDFDTGIARILRNDYIKYDKYISRAGYSVSMLTAAVGKFVLEEVRENSEQLPASTSYIGLKGDRLEMELSLISEKFSSHNEFGTTQILTFRDAENREAVWFNSGSVKTVDTYTAYNVKGTIKKLDTFRGNCQTVLSRCIIKST